jgi:hypothetical protein
MDVDPSWNWVSMMTGVLFLSQSSSSCMDWSRPRHSRRWRHINAESLTFRRVASDEAGLLTPENVLPRGDPAPGPARVILVNVDPASNYKTVGLTYDASGYCIGSVNGVVVTGFIDPRPPADVQSIALAGIHMTNRVCGVGFGGFIDLRSSTATLDLFESAAVK